MKYSLRWFFFSLLVACFIITSCTAAPQAPAKEAPAVVETVEGSEIKRVKLTEKAADRLGIKLDVVQESVVTRTRVVGGTVVDSEALASGIDLIPITSTGGKFISVRLSHSDLNLLDQSQPARVRLSAAGADGSDILAEPVGLKKAVEDVNAPLYFKVKGAGASLDLGQSVLVEYSLSGSGATKRSVPYAAVLYDLKGDTWVYTSPGPLLFTRQPVVIDYIDGDRAILQDGPPAGTQIVTVGVAELFGIDTGVDK